MRSFLPGKSNFWVTFLDGFADFYTYITTLGHSDKPDYERLTKILEKGLSKIE